MAKSKNINCVVLGLGRAGWDIHIDRLRKDKRYKIIAVADPMQERLDQAHRELGARGYKTPDELLKEEKKIDVAIIATPSQTHVPLGIDFLKKGCHVVVEKPLAGSLKESKRLVQAAKRAKKKLFVHHNYRFSPAFRFIRKVCQEGKLGQIFQIRCRMLDLFRRNDWQTLKKFNGGILNNHGTHYIDLLINAIDSPIKDVWADLKLVSDAGNTEDHAKVLLKAKDGTVLDIELSTHCADPRNLYTLLGQYGTMTGDGETFKIKRFDPKKAPALELIKGAAPGRQYGNPENLKMIEETVKVPKGGEDFYDNVFSVLKERGQQHVTPESVLEVIKIIENIHQSSRIQNIRPS